MRIYNVYAFIVLSLLNIHSLRAMTGSSEAAQVHFYINSFGSSDSLVTANVSNSSIVPRSFLHNFGQQNCQHAFVTYGCLRNLKVDMLGSNIAFKEEKIHDPLEQIVIEPSKTSVDHFPDGVVSWNYKTLKPLKDRVKIFMHPVEVQGLYGVTLSKENCEKYSLGNISPQLLKIIGRYMSMYIASEPESIWFDTGLGLYYVTTKATLTGSSPVTWQKYKHFPHPFLQNIQPDNNSWVYNLDAILTRNPNYIWAIYMHGHGSPVEHDKQNYTAGLRDPEMLMILSHLQNTITTNVFAVESCHTNAQRIIDIYKKFIPDHTLNFSVIASLYENSDFIMNYLTYDIKFFYPRWYNQRESQIQCPKLTISQVLVLLHKEMFVVQGQSLETRKDRLLQFLRSYPFYPRLSCLSEHSDKQIEIVPAPKIKYTL